MSPTTYGTGGTPAVNVNTPHVPLPTPRPAGDLLERIEQARARRAIRSPIQPPPGGWAARPCPEEHGYQAPTKRKHVGSPRAKWDTDRAITLAQQGHTTDQIADAVGASTQAVRRALAARGVTITAQQPPARPAPARKNSTTQRQSATPKDTASNTPRQQQRPAPRRRPAWDLALATRLAGQGLTAPQIAKQVHASPDTVRSVLRRNGITVTDGRFTGDGRGGGDRLPADTITAVVQLYTGPEQLSAPTIARHLSIGTSTVRKILQRKGVTLRDDRSRFSGSTSLVRRGALDPQRVVGLYAELGTCKAVAEHLDCSPQTVSRILRAADVTVRTAAETTRDRPGQDNATALKDLMRERGITAADVRTWARATGRDIPTRGVPGAEHVHAYLAAHPRRAA